MNAAELEPRTWFTQTPHYLAQSAISLGFDLVFLIHLLSAKTNLVNSESLLTQANFTFPRLICTLLTLQLPIFHE